MTKWTKDQWPDNIISGYIRYARAHNYDGFYLADASHGIPTIGAVSDSEPPKVRGQNIQVFNYPQQTEEIARRLVACWNYCVGLSTEEIEKTLQESEVGGRKKGD